VDDPELLDLVELELRDLLFRHGFVGRRICRDHFGPGRHRLACYLTDLQPRTGRPSPMALDDLFALLPAGQHVVTKVRTTVPSGEVTYLVAPITQPGHDSSGLGHERVKSAGAETRSQPDSTLLVVVTERSASEDSRSMATTDAVARDRFARDSAVLRNEDAPWARFDPNAYYHNNYTSLRADDKAILTEVGAFFSDFYARYEIRRPAHALDIGSGANLYPAMAMLPWSTHITLADHSPPNRPWLERAIDEPEAGSPWAWSPFWQILARYPGYDSLERPEQQFLHMHRKGQLVVEDLDILNLPPGRRWDLGTMFFVAESITEDYIQFTDAIRNFLAALRPGSPFAAAFMVGSGGYPVKGVRFPAVKTDADDIQGHFNNKVAGLRRVDIPKLNEPLRDHDDDNYDGMLLLVGVTEHS
jgi:hypothetical protein